jgi:molecular chaperone GrpE
MDLTKTAGEELLVKILPVVDDFERGLKNISDASDMQGVSDGIHLIYNKFKDFLTQQGVKEIEAQHQDFDFDLHEAVTKIPAPEEKLKGKIVDVVEKGYKLHDKVIRYSKVVIGE